MSRWRRFREDWQLKLTAVMLALLLWVLVAAERPTSEWVSVPVEVILRDPDHSAEPRAEPEFVSVRLSGPGREMWEVAIKRSRMRLLLPVREPVGEQEIYLLGPSMVRVPAGASVVARDVRPIRVRVRFDGS